MPDSSDCKIATADALTLLLHNQHALEPDALEHPALEHSTLIPLPLDQRIIEILSGAKSGAKISSAQKQ